MDNSKTYNENIQYCLKLYLEENGLVYDENNFVLSYNNETDTTQISNWKYKIAKPGKNIFKEYSMEKVIEYFKKTNEQ